jgi:hypothetical protein
VVVKENYPPLLDLHHPGYEVSFDRRPKLLSPLLPTVLHPLRSL